MNKKAISILLTAAMGVSVLAAGTVTVSAAEKKDKYVIGMSQCNLGEPWRVAMNDQIAMAAEKHPEFEVIFADAAQDNSKQIADIENFVQMGVDLIITSPNEATPLTNAVSAAYDAGIPVIIVDRMVDVSDDSLYTAWVGSNFKLEGQKAMAWLDAYLEAKGRGDEEINLVDIQGTIGASAQIGRTEGFDEAVEAHDNWTTLAQQSGEFTQAKGQEVMESILKQSGDDIDVVYCENDNEAFGAIDAIKAAGYEVGGEEGQILVMSFDTTNAGLTQTLSGEITCDTECNPLHGPRVEEIIQKLEAGEDVDKQAFVDEVAFASDDTVTKVTIDGTDYDITPITQEIIDGRAY